jgi:hypothetical protein
MQGQRFRPNFGNTEQGDSVNQMVMHVLMLTATIRLQAWPAKSAWEAVKETEQKDKIIFFFSVTDALQMFHSTRSL